MSDDVFAVEPDADAVVDHADAKLVPGIDGVIGAYDGQAGVFLVVV